MDAGPTTERSLQIRPAVESDAQAICDVLIRSVYEVCGKDYNNDPEILALWCSNKTPHNVRAWINDFDSFMCVVKGGDGRILGVGQYNRKDTSVNLCYLAPEALGKGLGSGLLREMEAEARRLGHAEVHLVSSITARSFYTRHGYASDGEPVYYGKVLGYPMRKRLSD